MPILEIVSIPHRYSTTKRKRERENENEKSVSIPHRYSTTKTDVEPVEEVKEFQFLIGTVQHKSRPQTCN